MEHSPPSFSRFARTWSANMAEEVARASHHNYDTIIRSRFVYFRSVNDQLNVNGIEKKCFQ